MLYFKRPIPTRGTRKYKSCIQKHYNKAALYIRVDIDKIPINRKPKKFFKRLVSKSNRANSKLWLRSSKCVESY